MFDTNIYIKVRKGSGALDRGVGDYWERHMGFFWFSDHPLGHYYSLCHMYSFFCFSFSSTTHSFEFPFRSFVCLHSSPVYTFSFLTG